MTTRLNPNRTEWSYRHVKLDEVEDYEKMGFYAHPEFHMGTAYWQDSMWMEWLCECPEPNPK